ncbi:LPS export ABC transporter permease LptF [Sphingomicrobium flavum]|uniref:LPS export ABC transporter permease LptF n=1 Tax=Sphingomicrobium flavum TaxID=1229164 RepID=UPI0021AD67E4|nr:LPS export ABC transporter permease LptF [Sphingomicrobium flavum]
MTLSLIDRYMAKTIFVPLVGTLIVAAMLLVLDKMLRLFDFVVALGGPVSVVFRMLANMLPEYFALGIPIGLLLGILLAFRKLALSSELDALRGIGVGYGRLLKVPYFYAFGLLALNLLIVSFLEPAARYNYEGLRFDLRSGSLGASIEVGEFNRLGKGMTLRIEESENDGTLLKGIFVAVDDPDDGRISASASEGQFLATDDPDVIIFRLRGGRLVQDNPDFASPRTLAFDSYDLPINLPQVDSFRGRGNEIKELYLPELASLAYFDGNSGDEQSMAARANLHFRLVEVIMMLMLPMLAIALAVPPKRSSSSLGIFIAIVMVVTYHKINQYAESAGAQGRLQPELALYIPFVFFIVLIGWMYHVIAHRPGGQPIGALEAGFAKIGKLVKKIVPDARAKALAARKAKQEGAA